MRTRRIPQSTKDMEHITASQLGEHLDEYLTRCSAENIGFVVDTNEKSYVLCPARWFDYSYDEDFGVIVNAALRYSIGRHTYMPSTVVDFIRKYSDILDDRTLHVICTDIEKALQPIPGVDDPAMWQTLLDECKAVLKQREK